jgi:thiol-disulfide isomerase/thioredoxin
MLIHMKPILTILFALIFNFVSAQIKFQNTWADAIQLAKQQNKLIYLDIYTTWCGPCKIMAKIYHPNTKVGEVFNKNFVSIKLDAEAGEGIQIAEKYNTQGYPSNYFIDPNTLDIIHFESGCPAELDDFLAYGTKALNAFKDPETIGMMNKKFQDERFDLDFVKRYIKKLGSLNLNNNHALNAYIKMASSTESKDSIFKYAWDNSETLNNNAFAFIIKNFELAPKYCNSTIYGMQKLFLQKLSSTVDYCVGNNDFESLNIAGKKLLAIFPEAYLDVQQNFITYHKRVEDFENYFQATESLYQYAKLQKEDNWKVKNKENLVENIKAMKSQLAFKKVDPSKWNKLIESSVKETPIHEYLASHTVATNLNNAAYQVLLSKRSDPKQLKMALDWANYAIKILPAMDKETIFLTKDTYASLMFALGNKSEAITYQKALIDDTKVAAPKLVKDLLTTLERMTSNKL